MSREACSYEDRVAAAASTGRWSPEVDAHRRECLSCAELSMVVAALELDAVELTGIDEPLPDPSAVWLRATLATRERDFRRATRAIAWVQRAAVAVTLAVGIFVAPDLLGPLADAIRGFSFSLPTAQLPRALGSPLMVLVASFVILGWLALWELTSVRDV